MAFLFLLQFTSAILRVFAKDTAAYHFLWPAHHEIGFALLVLVLLRGFWGLANIAHRPRVIGWLGRLAGAGHIAIYALMFAVPALGLLRAYGGGRGFSFLGLQVFAPTGVRDTTLMAPGNAVHGLFGWVLLALVAGHVLMALYHHFVLRDETLRHMAGRRV